MPKGRYTKVKKNTPTLPADKKKTPTLPADKKKTPTLPADKISELPASLIESILTRLSIREVVQTSILSRKWRYNWTNLPKLVFDDSLLPQNPNRTQLSCTSKDVLLTIYKILAMQKRPTLEFSLDIKELEPSVHVDLLVSYLSRDNVEKLTLWFYKDEYKLPKSLFTCSRLTHLDIAYCKFEPPLTFDGFDCLVSLELDEVSFDYKTFGSFISSCPLLERLTLVGCKSFPLELSSPKLKYLNVDNVQSILFKDVPILAIVNIQPNEEMIPSQIPLTMFFGSLHALEDLEIHYYFFMSVVAGGCVPDKLPTTLIQLRSIKLIQMSLEKLDEVLFVLCLLRSSPNLQRFTMQLYSCDSDLGVENIISEDCSDINLNQLKELAFHGASGSPSELEFIKLLLAKSPILESVLFESTSTDATLKMNILVNLVRFKRSSTAEIIFV